MYSLQIDECEKRQCDGPVCISYPNTTCLGPAVLTTEKRPGVVEAGSIYIGQYAKPMESLK